MDKTLEEILDLELPQTVIDELKKEVLAWHSRIHGEAVADRDLEWFQIIESFAGFHPVSMSDALDRGIKWAQRTKTKGSGANGTGRQPRDA